MESSNISLNYQPASATKRTPNIVLPGVGPLLREDKRKGGSAALDLEGTLISPEPSIVIKTKLSKVDNDDGSSQSILNISQDGILPSLTGVETKVFINICMHELISMPSKRKTLDEESGKEVDGWHLPMSMGELRPCFDKSGNAALVADCIMNPTVVKDMHVDSNHFHFVCDLVIQCATRKFSKPCFGGLELDKRYKVPKMKYAGYVDEKSGLPFDARMSQVKELNPVVAKQRIKGSGKSRPIIEEVDSAAAISQTVQPVQTAIAPKPKPKPMPQLCIELVVENEDKISMPLQDFLDGMAHHLQEGAMRNRVSSPLLKKVASGDSSSLHPSQLLKLPVPYNVPSDVSGSTIIARCTNATSDTEVEASAFLLILSSDNHSKTECVLPFPIDSHKTKCTFNAATKTVEIEMPLLQSLLNAELGPDPGTKQWGLANAFSRGTCVDKVIDDDGNDEDQGDFQSNISESSDTSSPDEDAKLPEDAFHSQDALSRHYLQQQEEEKTAKRNNHEQMMAKGRDDEDTEYIDIKDFQPGGKYYSENVCVQPDKEVNGDIVVLKKAEEALEKSLDSTIGGLTKIAFGLV